MLTVQRILRHFKNKYYSVPPKKINPKNNLRSKENKYLYFWSQVGSLEGEKLTCPWSLAELRREPRPPAKPLLPACCTKQLANLRVILFQFSGYLGWCNILATIRWIIINFLESFPVLCFFSYKQLLALGKFSLSQNAKTEGKFSADF